MEYCQYGNLAEFVYQQQLKTGNLSIELIKLIFGQIASACIYLHFQKRYVHRDIKMENILVKSLEPFPIIKLCDFGVTRVCDSLMESCATTPVCANLNILQGQGYNDDCDLFSIGCCLYYLVYKKYPCGSCKRIGEIIERIKLKKIGFTEEYCNEDKRKINELISKLMELDMKGKYSWEEFENNTFVKECRQFVDERTDNWNRQIKQQQEQMQQFQQQQFFQNQQFQIQRNNGYYQY